MRQIITRKIDIQLPEGKSAFLWGPRKSGKTWWISRHFPDAIYIDLLKTDLYGEYVSRPALLRERYSDTKKLIIIDEIQMIPQLLNEVHWLIENSRISFLLTGSSPRKLKRAKANMLGGRAWRFSMTPLSYTEVEGFDLERCMITGLLPPHYLSDFPINDLRAYIGDYLKEEVANEAEIQNIPAFADFLRVAAISSGSIINYTNIAAECGITAKTVKRYFQILEDTLLGYRIQAWRKKESRRLIEADKFYLFDLGVTNFLTRRKPVAGSPEFGHSFEQFILMELKAYQAYCNPELQIRYWRTAGGIEVDFILGDMDTAIEIKSGSNIHNRYLRPLRSLQEEFSVKKAILVCNERQKRRVGNIEVLPWRDFISDLWTGKLL